MARISFFPILVDDINSHVSIQCQTCVPIISHLIFYTATEKTSRVVFMFRRRIRGCPEGHKENEDNIWVCIILYLQLVVLSTFNNAEFVTSKTKICCLANQDFLQDRSDWLIAYHLTITHFANSLQVSAGSVGLIPLLSSM